MGKRRYEQICVRFHLDEERDRRLFQQITSLDGEKFRSKNQFILQAIEWYMEQMGENVIPESKRYASKKELQAVQENMEQLKVQLKNEIRTELYEQILGVLTGNTVANIALRERNEYPMVEKKMQMTEESFDLGSGEDVLEDVMKWS